MKIGVIASIAHRLPPANYGPWEQIASTLTEAGLPKITGT